MRTIAGLTRSLLSATVLMFLIACLQAAQAGDEIQYRLVSLESSSLVEPDLPWVDESLLAETHGKGYEAKINKIETEIGVILWDEVGEGNKNGHSLNVQVQGTGTVQSTSLTIRN